MIHTKSPSYLKGKKMKDEVIDIPNGLQEDVKRIIKKVGVYGLDVEKAQELGVIDRISYMLCLMHTCISTGYMIYADVGYMLDTLHGKKHEISKACNQFERSVEKFMAFWSSNYQTLQGVREMNRETDTLYHLVMKWAQLDEQWELGKPIHVENDTDTFVKVDLGDRDLKIKRTTVESRMTFAFPLDTVVIAYDKPIPDSVKESFHVVINKDTSQVPVARKDPVRLVLQNKDPWPTDAKVKVLMGYMDTTLARADSNGVRDTVIELKYKQLLTFETVPKLKLASLKGKIPGAGAGAYVRLKSVERTSYFYAACGSDGSFSFEDLVEGNYFVDYYYPEKGRQDPDAGSLVPFRFGSAWRSPNDTVKIANGANELEKLVPNLPALK